MRRQLNTLYVSTEGAWLHKDGNNVVMEVEGKEAARVPVHMLEGLVCLGRVLVSPPLLGFCAAQGICVSYLSAHGRFLARVEGPVSGNVLLRREQYRRTDEKEACVAIVRHLLIGKVHNQRTVLGRGWRDYGAVLEPPAAAALRAAQQHLGRTMKMLLYEKTIERLRG